MWFVTVVVFFLIIIIVFVFIIISYLFIFLMCLIVGLGDMAENCNTISVFHIGRYR